MMSFIDALEEKPSTKAEVSYLPDEDESEMEKDLVTESFSPVSLNSPNIHSSPFADLESVSTPLVSVSDSHLNQHFNDEGIKNKKDSLDFFKENNVTNHFENKPMPYAPSNFTINFSNSLAPSNGLFCNESSINELWPLQHDFAQNNLSSNDWNYMQLSTKNISPQFTPSTAAPIEVIDLTQSPRLDDMNVDNFASTENTVDFNSGYINPVDQRLHDERIPRIELSSPLNFSTLQPAPSTTLPILQRGSSFPNIITSTSIDNMRDHGVSLAWNNTATAEALTIDNSQLSNDFVTKCREESDFAPMNSSLRKKNRQHGKKASITILLTNKELWRKFFEIGTEMIITKAGRRMFPSIKLEIHGLQPLSYYIMAIDIVPVDNNRYRYVYHSSQWMAAGTTDSHPSPRTYIHPDSPCRGEIWMRQPITFDKLKLTNHEANKKGHVILNSMHKYQPRVHVIECREDLPINISQLLPKNKRVDEVIDKGRTTVVFPECAFTTVTAYQNQQITKLKIDRNPFAKGFRETNKQWRPKVSNNTSRFSTDEHSGKYFNSSFIPDTTATYIPPITVCDKLEQWQPTYTELGQTNPLECTKDEDLSRSVNDSSLFTEANSLSILEQSQQSPSRLVDLSTINDAALNDCKFDVTSRNISFQDLLIETNDNNKDLNYSDNLNSDEGSI